MDNAQKHSICINIPSSQTFGSYVPVFPDIGHNSRRSQKDSLTFICRACVPIFWLNLTLHSEVPIRTVWRYKWLFPVRTTLILDLCYTGATERSPMNRPLPLFPRAVTSLPPEHFSIPPPPLPTSGLAMLLVVTFASDKLWPSWQR
jgi:hypothetical protein